MAGVSAQQVGTQKPETHPPLAWKECTSSGCTSKDGSVVIDANWRWVHSVDGYKNCYTGNEVSIENSYGLDWKPHANQCQFLFRQQWDSTLCPDDATCATNCAVDGADYAGTYGATTEGDSLSINFVTGSNIGSRFYLMEDENKYQMFKLLNKEFTFDVDVSTLPCGLNGALYFVSMDADGGMSKYETNKAGAKYGTGYCDSQCPRDLKFINGKVRYS